MSADSLQAYDLVLRARRLNYAFTKPDNKEAKRLLDRAIALDPANARAHAALANCHHLDWLMHWAASGDTSLTEAHRHAKMAVDLDATDSYTQWTLGCSCLFERRYQNSRYHIERALELNPNDVEALALYGLFLTCIGETDEAIAAYREAEKVDPHHLSWMPWYWGYTYFMASRFEEAIEVSESVEQPNLEMLAVLAASYAYVGRSQEASRALDAFLSMAEEEMVDFPGRSATAWTRNWNSLKLLMDDQSKLWVAGLRKAGLDP
jgi:tetratricopeptide (TPR) repeat protein